MGPIGGMEEQFIARLFSIIPRRCHLGCVRFSEVGIGCLDWVYGWLFCLSLQGEEAAGLGSRRQTDYLVKIPCRRPHEDHSDRFD